MQHARRVFVTGLGAVGPHGVGTSAFERGLASGSVAIRRISLFDPTGLDCRIAGQVPDFEVEDAGASRLTSLAACAAREALESAGLAAAAGDEGAADAALHVRLAGARCGTEPERREMARAVAQACGAGGSVAMAGAVCASEAVGSGVDLVRSGRAERVVCGGAEACIRRDVVVELARQGRLTCAWNESPDLASRPLAIDRDGFVLAEGAWFVVLEAEAAAERRGATPWAEVAGFGSVALEARSALGGGREAARAFYAALHDAQQAPEAVDFVHLSAKGAPEDAVEAQAVRRVFAGATGGVDFAATQSLTGHALGVQGAAGLAAALLAVHGGFVPPTVNAARRAADCDLECAPMLLRRDIRWAMASDLDLDRCAVVILRRL